MNLETEYYAFSGQEDDYPVPLCPQTTDNFEDCFRCAWKDITNDWVGFVACATNGWACAIAAGLACALIIDNPDGGDDPVMDLESTYTYVQYDSVKDIIIVN